MRTDWGMWWAGFLVGAGLMLMFMALVDPIGAATR